MEIMVFFKDTKTTLQNPFFFIMEILLNYQKRVTQEEYTRDKYNQMHKLQATTLQNLLHNSFFSFLFL